MSTSDASNSSEFFDFPCERCARPLRIPVTAHGKNVQCPHCSHVMAAPAAEGEPPEAAPPLHSPSASPALGSSAFGGPALGSPAPGSVVTSSSPGSPGSPGSSSPFDSPWPAGSGSAPLAPLAPLDDTASTLPAPPPAFGGAVSGAPASSVPPGLGRGAPTAGAPPASPVPAGRETPTKQLFDRIIEQIGKVYVGQDELVLGTLVALFSSGHVLIESVPGLGKTLFVRTLGQVLGCKFGRIQFTADLMPSDITGAPIFDMKQQEFRFRPGPVFTQLLLADEINRSPAKTHAALLEIMQEYRVTIDGKSHRIERPFLVLATQNPIESEGTYNLPEAQLDRFMFKLMVDYPNEAEEAEILTLHSRQLDVAEQLEDVETVASPKQILEITHENSAVRVDDRLIHYINQLVRLTRQWPQFHMGASPRAGLALVQAARTLAAFSGRDYAVPDDVVQIAKPALRHRVILTAEAEVEGHAVDTLLDELIRTVEVPRI